jgi:hypothetical protein
LIRNSHLIYNFSLQSQHQRLKFVEMGAMLGERWRNLPAEEKQRYEDMAAEDKARFNREMEEYTANRVAQEPPQVMVPDSQAQQWQHYAMATGQHQAIPHEQAAYYHHPYAQDPAYAAHYDPNAVQFVHMDPYAHAAYQQQYGHYHYA